MCARCFDPDAFFFLRGTLVESLLLLAQLVQFVGAQRNLSNALVLSESGSQGVSMDIFGISFFKADIVIVGRPEVAPPQQGQKLIVAQG